MTKKICYIVGASDTQGIYIDKREDDYIIAADAGYSALVQMGITPDMVADAPTLAELTPRIKEIFDGMDVLIAYGISTDYSHIKYIYELEDEQEDFHKKIRCCANEFVRYIHEHRPDIEHASLTDAMACFEIEWDGVAHTSIADTIGCAKVWEKLFPNYYED